MRSITSPAIESQCLFAFVASSFGVYGFDLTTRTPLDTGNKIRFVLVVVLAKPESSFKTSRLSGFLFWCVRSYANLASTEHRLGLCGAQTLLLLESDSALGVTVVTSADLSYVPPSQHETRRERDNLN